MTKQNSQTKEIFKFSLCIHCGKAKKWALLVFILIHLEKTIFIIVFNTLFAQSNTKSLIRSTYWRSQSLNKFWWLIFLWWLIINMQITQIWFVFKIFHNCSPPIMSNRWKSKTNIFVMNIHYSTFIIRSYSYKNNGKSSNTKTPCYFMFVACLSPNSKSHPSKSLFKTINNDILILFL